jgi:hypothetical protein
MLSVELVACAIVFYIYFSCSVKYSSQRKRKEKDFIWKKSLRYYGMWKNIWGTCISLSKQLGISVSTLNTIIKNHNMLEENANQCRPMKKKRKYVKKSRFEDLKDF